MGRPKSPPIDEQRVLLLYDKFQSTRKVASAMQLPKERIRLVLKRHGITRIVETKIAGAVVDEFDCVRLKPAHVDARDFGAIATWIRDNPLRKLPRSAVSIAEIIGVTPNAIRTYFYRLRKRTIKKLLLLPILLTR